MKNKIIKFFGLTLKIAIIISLFIAKPAFSAEKWKTKKNSTLFNKVTLNKDYEKNVDLIVKYFVEEGSLEQKKANSLKTSLKKNKNTESHNERVEEIVNTLEAAEVISKEQAEKLNNDTPEKETSFIEHFFRYVGSALAAVFIVFLLIGAA
jgi:hypothetical protein